MAERKKAKEQNPDDSLKLAALAGQLTAALEEAKTAVLAADCIAVSYRSEWERQWPYKTVAARVRMLIWAVSSQCAQKRALNGELELARQWNRIPE